MSDNETKAPVEDVQMDTTPATASAGAAAADEPSTSAEESKPAGDEQTKAEGADAKETNGDAAAVEDDKAPKADEEKDDNVPTTAVAEDDEQDKDAAEDEDDAKPVSSKKPKSKNSSSNNNGASSAAPASSRRKSAGGKAGGASDGASHHSFKKGDIVLTRLKGYPPWPSIIVEGDEIPAKVMRQKPSGGRQIASMFFPTGDYAWSVAKDLVPLKKHEITAYLQAPSKKKKGELFTAYEVAEDPADWLAGRASGDADEDMEGAEDEDELADEVDEEPEESAGKKRKRGGEKKTTGAADTKAKKAKLEKLAKSKKSKDTVEDEDEAEAVEEPVSKKSAAKPKSSKKKVEEPKEPEAADENEEADPLANDPEAKKVKDWRHRLQRGFLGKNMPATEEIEGYNDLFISIEQYEGMTVDYLAYSKIGKVMKKIAALTGIPENEKFKFTDRASTMMSKWQTQVEQNQTA